ncbi:MAG: flagellar motor switch protein FliN [Bryobacterales bacterium]|nr:flagellar motor switch protein FliN [Bryobacterales bacterium]
MEALHKEILEQLGSQFSLALEGMLGEQWPSSLQDVQIPGDSSRYLCWSQKLNIHKDPVIQVAAGNAVWQEIGTRALVAVGLDNPEESDIKATYLELLTQALSGLARFLTGKAGTEVTLESGSEAPLPASSGGVKLHCLRLSSPTGFEADLFVRVEPVVIEALLHQMVEEQAAPQAEMAEQRQSQPQPQRAAAAAAAGPAPSGPPPPSMELLLDVEMPVSVSFGRTHLALKEVIKLSTGSIVELNRTITEPVEVIVNNCVIARGEVVVVEGNYGVRIQQIVSRSERLRSFD